MKIHTLTKLRAAHRSQDGAEGFLYMHQWPTGFQELIFANEKLAEQFLARLNQEPATDLRQDRIAETAKRLAQ